MQKPEETTQQKLQRMNEGFLEFVSQFGENDEYRQIFMEVFFEMLMEKENEKEKIE